MNVLVVDDHPTYRAGVHALLGHEPTIGGVVEAGSVSQALCCAREQHFDLAIVDVVLPETGGPSLVRGLLQLQPKCWVLALSMLEEPVRIVEMLRAGANGYALKSQPIDELISAIYVVRSGARYLPRQLTQLQALLDAAKLPLERLTARERDVFELLVRSFTSQQIADQLGIARRTIEAHRRQIMCKLGARSVVDLIRIAMRHGTIGTS